MAISTHAASSGPEVVVVPGGDWLVDFNAGYWYALPPTPLHYGNGRRLLQGR
jgi:hypothetical protein